MMKKWLLSGLLACGMTFGFAANAMADIVVGVVDMMGAVEQTEKDGVLKKLKNEMETRQNKLKASEKKVMAFQQEIKESASVLSEDKLREKAAQYQQMMLELQKEMQTYEKEMMEMQAKLMGEVQKKMTAISTDIAKERKLDLLLERSEGGVVYFNNTFDITAELVKRYKAGK
ncbi:MAG: OmpH family outer membrane protein [Proteobacteria bacterium]|jgi:outer membrane protein|nr:OmpH family outer membrane protein [Pseudomonadota bacterium]